MSLADTKLNYCNEIGWNLQGIRLKTASGRSVVGRRNGAEKVSTSRASAPQSGRELENFGIPHNPYNAQESKTCSQETRLELSRDCGTAFRRLRNSLCCLG